MEPVRPLSWEEWKLKHPDLMERARKVTDNATEASSSRSSPPLAPPPSRDSRPSDRGVGPIPIRLRLRRKLDEVPNAEVTDELAYLDYRDMMRHRNMTPPEWKKYKLLHLRNTDMFYFSAYNMVRKMLAYVVDDETRLTEYLKFTRSWDQRNVRANETFSKRDRTIYD